MIRAEFVRASFAAAALRPAPGATVSTQFSWIANVEYAGFFVAEASGAFASAGIRPRFLAGGPDLPSVAAVVAEGAADVGVDELDKVVDAVRAGHDLVVLGAIYQRPAGGLMSLPRRPIVRAADLVGARIGFQSGGREYIDGILRLNGLPLRYTAVPVGSDPDALVAGRCDAYLCYMTNQPLMLDERRIRYVVRSLTAFGYFGYDGCLFVRRAELTSRRNVLVRYLAAVARGWRSNIDDPVQGTAITLRRAPVALALRAEQQLQQNRAQAAFMQGPDTVRDGLMSISHRGVERAYETLHAGGRPELPQIGRLFDLSLLRDARHTRVA